MRDLRLPFLWFLLLLLLPACSVMPTPQPALEGFPTETLHQVRQQSTELERLQSLNAVTPAQQQQIQQLRSDLQQFARNVISSASSMAQKDDWHGAAQLLQGALRWLPDSQLLTNAQQQLEAQRQLREERVRMELAIHRGEQLLKDAEGYRKLQQLQGPGLMNWVEVKNYYRKRSESAQALQQHSQRALARGDYALAQRALKITLELYGDELQHDTERREKIQRDLAIASRRLSQSKTQSANTISEASADKVAEAPYTVVQQALDAGDLTSARQHLDQLRQQSPQEPQLPHLEAQFQAQLNSRIETALKRGNDLYSQGKIERALAVWREASTLAPENVELLANIARAEKVLENLRALSVPASATP
ncbi:tetratricopeptide repeat protein [Microbulbifer pacificus]|uniref:Tetratricopeptide repeat-containing protein n=1 Tax=Microbulbifer pacificus TaxID=407164 RepID=A0AAU0MZY8_9GAMM|nr:hypothetical protein [Microbulbifer pacificus]WOX06246.1 hypothetical protein R5R33_03715 [Microbulbifer pacificus]